MTESTPLRGVFNQNKSNMRTIKVKASKLVYDADKRTFTGSGKIVPFDTSYMIENELTGVSQEFNLTHSTGSEWDPKTIWVYVCKSDPTLFFHLKNDEVTPEHERRYLEAKMRH